ncbi:MAG: NADH-quinone oxidoreductase subunit N [Candidatus Omnitrophica bacterium]|nr:NADH-quinone oxidoreductase subunit N [Candidatus Omnitrophota bacterium]
MNALLTLPEIAVVALGLGLLLLDLWTPPDQKRQLGYIAVAGLGLILAATFTLHGSNPQYAFGQIYVMDGLALFFKRFFLLGALFVLVMSTDFADRFPAGIGEYYALILFALAGMMWAASANDYSLLFVAIELITISFYVLNSFRRNQADSLEAGAKYLILGALASAFLVYGIAFVYGGSGTLSFHPTGPNSTDLSLSPIFQLGLAMVLVGLGFKIAAFPFQIWAPDVYQGSPTPTTAFLAIGSKAAGFVLLLRVLFSAAPDVATHWRPWWMAVCAITILYGNLGAVPQRNVKRLLGYSSIAHAGYMLLGVAAMSAAGAAAILYYLGGYLFTLAAAFTVICLAFRKSDTGDLAGLAGLHHRSPFLAATLTLAMVSLAGIPPLAGFFGKFLLLKAVVQRGITNPAYYWLVAVALFGIVVSLYFYLNVVRAIYWSKTRTETAPIEIPRLTRFSLYGCIAGMLYLGLLPNTFLNWAQEAVKALHLN